MGVFKVKSFNERYLDFCRPFIDAVKDIYKTMMNTEISTQKPQIKQNHAYKGDHSAIIGINGFLDGDDSQVTFQGTLVLSWPETVYLKTAEAMLGETYAEFSTEIEDLGCEVANITLGNSKRSLAEQGYKVEMSTPTSIRGKDHNIKSEKNVITIHVPLSCDFGEFYMDLNYTDELSKKE